ncbi:MAG: hypothetical protein H6815_03245 [Phycisphaeraceae bacterium]|nr:hypothetical protein [Phycisphaerales bacterium]MCB9859444.1 hypothetical protein [Phycisphaeraceae bacterium]
MGVDAIHLVTLADLIPAESLPLVLQFLAAAGIGIGLVLWLAGQRMVRGMFAVLGLVTGAGTGFFASSYVGYTEIANVPTPLVGLIAGALVGLLASVLLYRAFMAVGSAAVLGFAAVLAAGVMTMQPAIDSGTNAAVALTPSQMLLPGVPEEGEAAPDDTTEVDEPESSLVDRARELLNEEDVARIRAVSNEAATRAREFGSAVYNEAELVWLELSPRQRTSITLWGLAGLGLGFLFGVVMPGRSSMFVTSVMGAAIWMPCALWLMSSMSASTWMPQWDRMMGQPPMFWVCVWIALSLFGITAQWVISPEHRRRKRRALVDADWDEDE